MCCSHPALSGTFCVLEKKIPIGGNIFSQVTTMDNTKVFDTDSRECLCVFEGDGIEEGEEGGGEREYCAFKLNIIHNVIFERGYCLTPFKL